MLVRARPLSPPWLVSLCGAVLPGHAAVGPLTHTYPPDEVHGGPPALGLRSFRFDDPRPLLGAGPDQVTFELGDRRKDVEKRSPCRVYGIAPSASMLVAVW